MPEVLRMERRSDVALHNYPQESRYTRWGFASSVAAHLLVILIVAILAWLNHIKSLAQFMSPSMNQPPPPTEVEVVLVPDEIPPPPTDHPEWIKQIVQIPKPIIPPKPKPKPVPKPQPIVKHTPIVSHAVSKSEATFQVGSGGLQHPDYPFNFRKLGLQGIVKVRVTFDASGRAVNCDIVSSSGSSVFVSHTRSFILDNWVQKELANSTEDREIRYQLQQP